VVVHHPVVRRPFGLGDIKMQGLLLYLAERFEYKPSQDGYPPWQLSSAMPIHHDVSTLPLT
jgi:hypothetical protein